MYTVSVIIPAAGSGKRMNSDISKPFLKIQGKTILEYSVSRFLAVPNVQQIIIAASRAYFSEVHGIIQTFEDHDVQMVCVEGGAERQFSIHNAIDHLTEVDLVAVHDAVRPFVSEDSIKSCFNAAFNDGAAILGIPARDTIKKVDKDGFIAETLDRRSLWQCQTPQVFRKNIFMDAYQYAEKHHFVGTDDASVIEFFGEKVRIVEGGHQNIKLTYPLDLKLAELIINQDNI